MADSPLKAGPDGYVPVAGLRVPSAMVPRVIAAVRGVYPTITEGLPDDAAIRAWLKYLISQTLVQHEGTQAIAEIQTAVEETRREYEVRAEQAREKAAVDAETIVESAPTIPPVTPRAGRPHGE